MAGEECMVCLMATMDSLWFHQIILFSFTAKPPPQSLLHSSKNTSQTQHISPRDGEISSQETDDLEMETATEDDKRATRLNLNLVPTKGSHHSSSPISSAHKRSRKHPIILKKSRCFKSLMDLELEEVKGFMDLSFIFRRENLTKRSIHLVPDLQRIGHGSFQDDDDHEDEDEDEGERKEINRPYLSEAWIDKTSPINSPLLMNLRIPAVSTASDMKKLLKYWAHTVASAAIHQEYLDRFIAKDFFYYYLDEMN